MNPSSLQDFGAIRAEFQDGPVHIALASSNYEFGDGLPLVILVSLLKPL